VVILGPVLHRFFDTRFEAGEEHHQYWSLEVGRYLGRLLVFVFLDMDLDIVSNFDLSTLVRTPYA
jgi:hypothetical protein